MKNATLIIILVLCCLKSFAQQEFYYNMLLKPAKGANASKLYVAYEIAGIKLIDSLALSNKQFTISKKLAQPVAATLYTNNKTTNSKTVFLANNTLHVSIDGTSIEVEPTKLQNDFLFLTENDRIRPKYFLLYSQLNAKKDTAGLNKLTVVFDSLKADDVKRSYNYFKANKASLLSLFAFNRFTTSFADYSKVEDYFNLLPTWAKGSPDGKNVLLKIQGAKSTQLGNKAIRFTAQSSKGENISLESLKGKYVLLDFWASWCGPCRKEHPDLVLAYKEFKEKGFEIVSVSLDTNEKAWMGAIEKDNMSWTNISNLKGFQNEIALKYGVQVLPTNFLINPEGAIIDKDLKGEEVITKLKALIDK